ncbi:MAG: thioredoxin family protein [Pseudodesulfovibrio sp.]|uniref:Thioredoxin domain-containing protein n=2 Tax=Pseudodesulfovibrio aespoeensis TaxID=182210 RepID=E6VXR9_PSEA9|nr:MULTISPECIES: thioredoxin family protein [Pseudodesulfovibrio]MBU4193347.1 thioredoxin family protein [Pseudomonadota bacterium]MBV1737511.1 thioredoxin family protein [Desulfarculus sp.]ADU61527.1 Thioredoxin domain-containing protein [Pseudodesulfovibrio aespoeensis Aspo-2]MBU4244532.1 thioredoxin family protein [Pseudomonadota bacterium]MBU4379071.1 thioredoxin family protein [Pseudomonadota bacterium]
MKKPLLLAGLLVLAVVASVAVYLLDPDPQAASTGTTPQAMAADPAPASGSPTLSAGVADLLSGRPQVTPVPGMVTMVDIGAHSCIPCKMMAPILKEVAAEQEGRAAIVFIDVWQYNDEVKKYGIRVIPTQIFYDAEGRERFRHEGFMSKADIVVKLVELGMPGE